MSPREDRNSVSPTDRRAHVTVAAVLLGVLLTGVCGLVVWRLATVPAESARGGGATPVVPVEVAAVRIETIERRRVFSGSLEASARVGVSPKITGRVVERPVELSDTVRRGDLLARLDSAEALELVAQAEADLSLAEARVARAGTSSELSAREFDRVEQLHGWGDASDSELDSARAGRAASAAEVRVAEAERSRAAAALTAAQIRLGYTEIRASWTGGPETRVVASLSAEVGDLVSPARTLATVVGLDPIEATIFVTESDYAAVRPGLPVRVTTDAFPGRSWDGEVARVAPVFREGSRQARVEVRVPNPEWTLKPGMFVRVEATLGSVAEATVVPASALVERGGASGVFVLSADGSSVALVPAEAGIRDGDRLQVIGEGVRGRVVTLGQHLLDDGSAVTVPGGADVAGGS